MVNGAEPESVPVHPLFLGSFGLVDPLRKRDPEAAREQDRLLDEALDGCGWTEWLAERPQPLPVRNILIVLTAYPDGKEDAVTLARAMASRHKTYVHVDARPDVPRFAKANEAVRAHGAGIDWLILCDDDIAVRRDFLGRFIDTAEMGGLAIAQPAHRIHSYSTFAVTQRKPRSILRRTSFVEIGPLVAIHRSVFWKMLPFPDSRYGWGIDFLWADWARTHQWRIGVVDDVPIEHLRSPDTTYGKRDAGDEASRLLALHAPDISRAEMLGEGEVLVGW
jgi:hypothetical protein